MTQNVKVTTNVPLWGMHVWWKMNIPKYMVYLYKHKSRTKNRYLIIFKTRNLNFQQTGVMLHVILNGLKSCDFRLFALFWKNKYIFQHHNKKKFELIYKDWSKLFVRFIRNNLNQGCTHPCVTRYESYKVCMNRTKVAINP